MLYDQMESPAGSARQNISLVITNAKGDEIGRYDFQGAFVTRYKGPSFNAKQSDLAFEEIEITYDWFVFHPGDALTSLLDSIIGAAVGKLLG
jgi:phage tail-like protein